MSSNSAIEWTRHTGNLWWGCVEVSSACDNCYAREWAKRYDRAKWGADEPRLAIKSVWKDFQRWQRDAAAAGEIHNVFVGSMMDIFEKAMPLVDAKGEAINGVTTEHLRTGFCKEVVPASPNLLFLLLTKRAGNIEDMVPPEWLDNPPPNVMYGTSVGTQLDADREIPKLVAIPGMHFLSIEPLLEPIRFGQLLKEIDWGIVGCESNGSRAGRFADGYEDAARAILMELAGADVRGFHKQMPINGRVSHDMSEWPADLRVRQMPRALAETTG